MGILQYSVTATLTIALGSSAPSSPGRRKVKPTAARQSRPPGVQRLPAVPNPIYGEPLAPGMMQLLAERDRRRRCERGAWTAISPASRAMPAEQLNATAGAYTGSELTGNCRLRWYDHMLRNPLQAPAEAEEFTRDAAQGDRRRSVGAWPRCWPPRPRSWTSASASRGAFVAVHSPQEALEVVKQALVEAQAAYAAALAPLSKGEVQELATYLYPVLVGQNHVGHTINDRGTGRRLCDLMEKMDRGAMIDAAEALVPLDRSQAVGAAQAIARRRQRRRAGRHGAGGGEDRHAGRRHRHRRQGRQHLPARRHARRGGGDRPGRRQRLLRGHRLAGAARAAGGRTWAAATSSSATSPGVQGGAILGVSMLVNLEGGNRYEAQDVAQGSCLAGRRHPHGVRRQQQAIAASAACKGRPWAASGILIDRGGHNDYHAAMWAQGMGGPLGFGLLENLGGGDHYYCGGLYPNSYKPETPGYEGLGQGVGGRHPPVGRRRHRRAAQRRRPQRLRVRLPLPRRRLLVRPGLRPRFRRQQPTPHLPARAFYGGERTEQLFQRFGCGWGCHYALGFCFDDRGNSTYEGTIMGSGMAWDCSVGVLCSFGGKDHYMATGGLTQGCGAQAGLGILYHYGDDSRVGGLTPGLRLAGHQLSPPARVRRQLQLPDQLRRQQHASAAGPSGTATCSAAPPAASSSIAPGTTRPPQPPPNR